MTIAEMLACAKNAAEAMQGIVGVRILICAGLTPAQVEEFSALAGVPMQSFRSTEDPRRVLYTADAHWPPGLPVLEAVEIGVVGSRQDEDAPRPTPSADLPFVRTE